MKTGRKMRMAIIAGYVPGESYGLLGPQMAATVIQENTPYGMHRGGGGTGR
ncbi:MAG: hypothetical protein JRF51_16200 [Deltaproteobacteria bacterium]|nr:hypothetical protein [Deltaproteobacteria bacterium]MBW2113035.1 hypothetical protein [Deltaproteobacteria bacterium]MBW2354747.1 hypothetical protein [Deltaproteobacteria bacterium]